MSTGKEKYTDHYGGINDVSKSMAHVRERALRMMEHDVWLRDYFINYEKYYQLLNK